MNTMTTRTVAFSLLLIISTIAKSGAYEITLFTAAQAYNSDVKVLNQNLGLDEGNLIVEDFEDEELIEGLTTNLKGGFPNGSTTWDGMKCSTHESEGQFKLSLPDVRLFGIGLGDNDMVGTEQLSINGGPPIDLKNLPNYAQDSSTRAFYLIVRAESGDADIENVAITKGLSIGFDHLVLQQEKPDPNRPLQLLFDLVDGSRLIGRPATETIHIEVVGKKMEIPLERISTIQPDKEGRLTTLTLKNRDKLTGTMHFSSWKVSTLVGDLSIDLAKVKKITVQWAR